MDWLLREGWKWIMLAVVSGGGGAAITVRACMKFGEKWLDAKFAQRFEKLKHDQAKEIEGIRQQVQWEFSRISKIHDKEFEVLPAAWLKFHEAYGRSADLVGRVKQTPDLDNMSDEQFAAFVAATELPKYHKDELAQTPKGRKNNLYNEKMSWIDLSAAERAQTDLNNYVVEYRILMTDDLAEAFQKASTALALVNSNYRIFKQTNTPNLSIKAAERFGEIAPQIQQIGSMIQKRLNYEKA